MPGLLGRIDPPRKVAIVRASRVGDFICATPAFRSLRPAMPGAEITLIGLPMVRDLVDRSPHLDRFVEFPGFPGMAEQFFEPHAAVEFFRRMQAERFDLAIQMHGSGANSNPFTLLLGASYTAGFIRPGGEPGSLDAALPLPGGHEIDRNLALAEFVGAPGRGRLPDFPLLPDDRARGAALLDSYTRPRIGIHAGAREEIKRWSLNRFEAMARAVRERHGGTVVLLGDETERAGSASMALELSGCLDLTGQTALGELGGVIERLDVLITNDSGPAHIAYALGTASVTIFGGTDPAVWGPRHRDWHQVVSRPIVCRPCGLAVCPIGYRCLEAVTVDEVVQAVSAALDTNRQADVRSESCAPAPATHD